MDKTLVERLEALRNHVACMVKQVPDDWADAMVELRDDLTQAMEAAAALRATTGEGGAAHTTEHPHAPVPLPAGYEAPPLRDAGAVDDDGEKSPGLDPAPPSTPAQHWLATRNAVATQEWQDGFNTCAARTPPAPAQVDEAVDDGGPYNGIDWPETLRAAAKRLRLGVEGPRIADELEFIAEALAHPAPAQVDEACVLAALGHEPQVSDNCTARVIPTPSDKPGPRDPPIWCHLKAGHDGPHRCNHGGGYRSFPFRKSDPVEFREPVTICAKCRTRWPCPEAEKVSAALTAAAKEVDR